MELNKSIEAARAQLQTDDVALQLTKHEWHKVSEALRHLSRSKQAKMAKMPADDFRRKSFGYDIHLINSILDKTRKQLCKLDN